MFVNKSYIGRNRDDYQEDSCHIICDHGIA